MKQLLSPRTAPVPEDDEEVPVPGVISLRGTRGWGETPLSV